MSKAVSYFDWELNFRKKPLSNHSSENITKRARNKENCNSLGISDKKFQEFMKGWRETNL